jgi:hypothetical protein
MINYLSPVKIVGSILLFSVAFMVPANAQRFSDGNYDMGPMDGALQVRGKKYKFQNSSIWRPVSELIFVKKGVVKLKQDGAIFCLSTVTSKKRDPQGRLSYTCTDKGWLKIKYPV